MNKGKLEELLAEGETFYRSRAPAQGTPEHLSIGATLPSSTIASREALRFTLVRDVLATTPFQIFIRPRRTVGHERRPPSPISSPNESDTSLRNTQY